MEETEFQLFTSQYDDEGVETKTSEAKKMKDLYIQALRLKEPEWFFSDMIQYLSRMINNASEGRMRSETSLITMALYMLAPIPILGLEKNDKVPHVIQSVTSFLQHRQNKDGIFTGLPQDNPTIIINMLTISGIAICGTETCYKIINRENMYKFLMSLKNEDGSFSVSLGAEADLRSTYSALVIAKMLNIMTNDLTKNVLEYCKSCYNFDGGFGPIPHCESHSGFIHCGIGILYILGKLDDINLYNCVRFIALRQDDFSGGFSGRTNKLVDSCYSWWLGTSARILAEHLKIPPFWNVEAMSRYIIQCCQIHSGGYRDSPPNDPDPFHTCYALAGLCTVGNGELVNERLSKLSVLTPVPQEKMDKIIEYFSQFPPIA